MPRIFCSRNPAARKQVNRIHQDSLRQNTTLQKSIIATASTTIKPKAASGTVFTLALPDPYSSGLPLPVALALAVAVAREPGTLALLKT